MTFTLKIELGNDAMQTYDDIAAALRKVAARLNSGGNTVIDEDADLAITGGRIKDVNGNTVGEWSL
jgi:hypothetical protein